MGVLDKFFILFESDTSDAVKNTNKLDKSLDNAEKSSIEATNAANEFSEGAKNLSAASKLAAADIGKMSKEDIIKSKQIDNLNALSKDLRKLEKTKALKIGKKIGLTEKQVTLLRKGKIGVRELSNELKSSQAQNQFVNLGKKALGAAGGIVALTSAITGLISTAGRTDTLGKFADLIGENISDIDAWGGAVVRAGGTTEGFRDSIKSLNEKMIDAKIKGANEITPFFNQLGISIVDSNNKVKSVIAILPELADSFQRVGKQKSLGIGQKLGFDSYTIALLQQGRSEIDKLIERQKKLGLVNEKAAAISAEFNDIVADLKQVLSFAAQSLMIDFAPAITWTIDKLVNLSMWARENKPIVYGFFIGLAAVATPALLSLAASAWAAIVPLLLMAAPFIAIGLAAGIAGAAIALVIEDIVAFLNGQDSLIGKIADKWPIVGKIIRKIADGIKNYIEIMKMYADFLIGIFLAPKRALENLIELLKKMKNFLNFDESLTKKIKNVKSFFGFGEDENEDGTIKEVNQDSEREANSKTLNEKVTQKINVVKSFFGFGEDENEDEDNNKKDFEKRKGIRVRYPVSDKKNEDIKPTIIIDEENQNVKRPKNENQKTMGSKIKSFFGFNASNNDDEKKIIEINKNVNIGHELIIKAANSPLAAQTSNSIQNDNRVSSRNTSVQTGDIVVQTQATDHSEIASNISESLQNEIRTTIENFDDGIMI